MFCAVAFGQMERGSFIKKLCNSTPALVKHAQSDPDVMDRYKRHFAMTDSEVVDYLGTLKLTTLQKEGLYVVYGAPSGGPLRSRLLRVQAGTKVFTDATGEVILLWHCGNPVTRGPKVPLDVNRPVASPAGLPAEEMRAVPLQAPVATMESSMIVSSEPIIPDIPVVPEQQSNIPIVTPPSSSGLLGILPILGIIHNTNNNNPPVPEPATIAVIGLGIAGIASRKRNRR